MVNREQWWRSTGIFGRTISLAFTSDDYVSNDEKRSHAPVERNANTSGDHEEEAQIRLPRNDIISLVVITACHGRSLIHTVFCHRTRARTKRNETV